MASGDVLLAGRLIFILSSVYCPMANNLKGITLLPLYIFGINLVVQ
jgi:hypothetical protein